MNRPKLDIGLDSKIFKEYYYLKEELVKYVEDYYKDLGFNNMNTITNEF
jgi:hypothetical protein